MTSIADLRNKAKDAGIDPAVAGGSKFEPTEGETYTVSVDSAGFITSKGGFPAVNFGLTVIDGPDGINRTMYQTFTLSPNMHENTLARAIYYIESLGVDMDVLETMEPSSDFQKPNLIPLSPGHTATFEAKYREDKSKKVWPDHHWSPAAAAAVIVEEDEVDADWLD